MKHDVERIKSPAGAWVRLRCRRCEGVDSGLPAHCPGRPLSDGERHGILSDAIDFYEGAWIDLAFEEPAPFGVWAESIYESSQSAKS